MPTILIVGLGALAGFLFLRARGVVPGVPGVPGVPKPLPPTDATVPPTTLPAPTLTPARRAQLEATWDLKMGAWPELKSRFLYLDSIWRTQLAGRIGAIPIVQIPGEIFDPHWAAFQVFLGTMRASSLADAVRKAPDDMSGWRQLNGEMALILAGLHTAIVDQPDDFDVGELAGGLVGLDPTGIAGGVLGLLK